MNTRSRITSVLNADCLDSSVTGIPSFNLSELHVDTDLEFQLPSNLRLGHLAEKIVSELIKSSTNYNVVYENIQVIEDKKTIGEIDFIIKDINSDKVIHLELAYKFYLYDPTISKESINNWIGPNRNDSLNEKLEKLKQKQFPLLYHKSAKSKFPNVEIDAISQALCLLVSLYVPYKYIGSFNPIFQKAIKGYYMNIETFKSLDHSAKTYYLPLKKEWGIDPSENENWKDFNGIKKYIDTSLTEKQAPLCWQKHNDSFESYFIVWW